MLSVTLVGTPPFEQCEAGIWCVRGTSTLGSEGRVVFLQGLWRKASELGGLAPRPCPAQNCRWLMATRGHYSRIGSPVGARTPAQSLRWAPPG